jgi:hypothetical protein
MVIKHLVSNHTRKCVGQIFAYLDLSQVSFEHIFITLTDFMGAAVAQLVEALHYKPEGRRFDS